MTTTIISPVPSDKDREDWNNRIVQLTKQAPKYITKPFLYKDLAFSLLDEGVTKGFISYEYSEQKKADLHHKLNSPNRAKDFLKRKMIQARNKLPTFLLNKLKSKSKKEKKK